MASTVILLSVSVPVLSEQIIVVLPKVSTAGSLRIMALRFAILETPIAKVMVKAAGKPSGIAPTANATEAMNISNRGCPRQTPIIKVTVANPMIIHNNNRLN